MAFKKTYKRKGTKKTFKRKSYAKRTPLKKVIKQVIARNVEVKTKQNFNYNKNIYPSNAVLFPDNVIELGPSAIMGIDQGTANGSRIGNKIRTKKLVFKGSIVPAPYSAQNPSPQPMQLKMWILYDRANPTNVPSSFTDFFQNGGSNTGFQNDLVDLWRPVNEDRYRVLASKTFKIGVSSANGTGYLVDSQGFNNNDFKYNANFSFDLTKHYPKEVKFDENSLDPMTRGLYCVIAIAQASGAAYGASAVPAQIQYMQDYRYTDA